MPLRSYFAAGDMIVGIGPTTGMIQPTVIEAVHTKYERLRPLMNERMRRQYVACEALALARGGVAAVAKATGLSRTTIWAGMRALQPAHHTGWLRVGIDHDTAYCATETVCRWWQERGRQVYSKAEGLLVTADAGGSHRSRSRSWKVAVQEFATRIRLRISVCRVPPGTSTWTTIDHRLFYHITSNWRGRPLISCSVSVNFIGNTTTTPGLPIKAALDRNLYDIGLKVIDEQPAALYLQRNTFHGEWNYTLSPRL